MHRDAGRGGSTIGIAAASRLPADPGRGRLHLRLDAFDINGDWFDSCELAGNLFTGAGINSLWNGLATTGLATPFSATNAQLAVGDGSTTAKPSDTDLAAAAGASLGGGITGATNATPIVLTTSTAHGVVVGQVVVVASVGGNTNANGTFEVSAVTSTTLTLLNSAGNAAYTSGGTVALINKYRQAATPTVNPAVGGGITGATNATPIVITTSAAHGLADGMVVSIAAVGGNTNANTTCYVKVTGFSTTTFGLYTDKALTAGVAGNAAYTSGGTVNLIGGVQYAATFQPANANFTWNEFALTTGGGATNKQAVPPPTLFDHAISAGMITKGSTVTVTATATLTIN
jgi:hypothetical protein